MLRTRTRIVVAVAAVLAATAVFAVSAPAAAAASRTSARVTSAGEMNRPLVALVNQFRRARGLRALKPSPLLERAAEAHSASMGRLGFFRHASADGSSFNKRLARFYPSPFVGEAIAWQAPDMSPRETLEMWLASPGHRALLVMPEWREIGIGAVRVANAGGFFGGTDATIVTANFGARS